MKITQNFKRALKRAKRDADYERLVVTCGSFKATTYCCFYSIEDLLSLSIGKSVNSQHSGRWAGHSNTRQANPDRDIFYRDLMRHFSD